MLKTYSYSKVATSKGFSTKTSLGTFVGSKPLSYKIDTKGIAAYENYLKLEKQQTFENSQSAETTKISNQANKVAKQSNILSIVAIIISAAIGLYTIIRDLLPIILTYFK